MHHSAHQTSGSAFLNPCPRFSSCPARPLSLRLIHPPFATLGHESRLCMTAHNIPCHKCFPKASTSVTLSADKTSPQPLMECASHFSECVNNFWLAGQTRRPGNVCSVCLCVCILCAYVCLNIFTSLCFFSVFFYMKQEKRAMSFFHNLIRSYTQERAAAAWTSLIMLMRSPGYAVIEV